MSRRTNTSCEQSVIGSPGMNFVAGTTERAGARTVLISADGEVRLPLPQRGAALLQPGQRLTPESGPERCASPRPVPRRKPG